MKIAINGQKLTVDKLAGPELYTLNLIKALSLVDAENSYCIYLDKSPNEEAQKVLENLGPNFSVKILPAVASWTQVSLLKELYMEKFDVFFTAVHTFPFLYFGRTKIVSMIHGLEYVYADLYHRPLRKVLAGLPEKLVCRFSDKIVAPSEFTKEAILSKVADGWKLKNPDIAVIPEGVSDKFKKSSTEEISKTISHHEKMQNINLSNRPYLIFISTIQPRKNLKSIIEAIALLKDNYGIIINLLVCGKLGWDYDEDLAAPGGYEVPDQVFFLGRVPEEDLISLLSGSVAYISASFEEGFGLPLLEAMACEVPAIVSDIPAYRSIAKDAAIYFDPHNVQDIAAKIHDFLKLDESSAGKSSVREAVLQAKIIADSYTWEQTASKMLRIFTEPEKV